MQNFISNMGHHKGGWRLIQGSEYDKDGKL